MKHKPAIVSVGLSLLLLAGCAISPALYAQQSVERQTISATRQTVGEATQTEELTSAEETTRPPETAPEMTQAALSSPEDAFSYCGLVDLFSVDDSFFLDQKYATEDNFTGVAHYDRTLCLVQKDILPMLIRANDAAKAYGYRIKIWDAYRPISVQQALSDSAPPELQAYVPEPSPYSMHARGITVDVTLCDPWGNNLDMPTDFDDFSPAAHRDYGGATQTQIDNRELLISIMTDAGFTVSGLEWWHFDGPNRDNYEILDVSFGEFEAARDAAED